MTRSEDGRPRGWSAAQIHGPTVLIFITTVVLVSVSAGVLFSSSLPLRERVGIMPGDTASGTAELDVISVVGGRAADGEALDRLQLYVVLPRATQNLDLASMEILVIDGQRTSAFGHGVSAGADSFAVTALRDEDQSMAAASAVMTSGDLVRIDLDLGAAGGGVMPGAQVRVTMVALSGEVAGLRFQAPDGFGVDPVVPLL